MDAEPLSGRRLLVVGASTGLGRAIAVKAIASGGDVVVAARRADRLADVIAEAGGGAVVTGDVRDPAECSRVVDEAVDLLGSLDVVLYAAGYAPLRSMVDTDDDDWREVFATNVFGVNRVIAAAVPRMEPDGVIAVLSSETVGRPRFALGAYSASKAALEESLRAWQLEHPTVRFSCVAIGATQPTDFGNAFDPDLLGPAYQHWVRHGFMQERFMDTDDVAEFLVDSLATALRFPGVNVEHLLLRSPSPVLGAPEPERRSRG
jgi:NAD(P)-dependent dehydrogenase (short-subunit alcohol dehydrogenase family)